MKWLKQFGTFWFDFIVGDDWRIAVGVVVTTIGRAAARDVGRIRDPPTAAILAITHRSTR